MKYNEKKVDEVVLALLYLTVGNDHRAWKGHDWGALNRLHERADRKSKDESKISHLK